MKDRSDWPVRKSTLAEQGFEDDLAHLTMGERMALMWPLTVQAWALAGEPVVEQEFQRHVIRVERRGG
jgi:hypothetical protein